MVRHLRTADCSLDRRQLQELAGVVLLQSLENAGVEAAQIYATIGPCDAKVGSPLDLFPVRLQFVIIAELMKHSVKGFFVEHNLPVVSSSNSLGQTLAGTFIMGGAANIGLFLPRPIQALARASLQSFPDCGKCDLRPWRAWDSESHRTS